MGFKYLWISAPELFKAEQLFVATTGGALKWVRQLGVVHDRVFLEAIPISCLSSLWFQWSLSVEGMKERKKKYRERWDLRENEGKKEKKKVVKLKEKKHLPLKTKTFLPYTGVAVKRKTFYLLHNNFWKKMLSSCGYVVKKEPHHIFFFLVKANTVHSE